MLAGFALSNLTPADFASVVGALGLALLGVWSGLRVGRQTCWIIGYLTPLIMIGAIAYGRRHGLPLVETPIGFLAAGAPKYLFFAFAIALLLTTLYQRLASPVPKRALSALGYTAVLQCSLMPLALPVLVKPFHDSLRTTVDDQGICRQTTRYTCGPAAAVTALRQLGLHAREGVLANLALTNPLTGTDADCLYLALQQQIDRHIDCHYQQFGALGELGDAGGPVLTEIRYDMLRGHWVVVLELTEHEVILGDPDRGLTRMKRDRFETLWVRRGIVLRRA